MIAMNLNLGLYILANVCLHKENEDLNVRVMLHSLDLLAR